MSLLDGSKKEVVANFHGAKPALDIAAIEPDEANLAFNCTFELERKVVPREGFGTLADYGPTGRAFQSVRFWEQGQSGSQTLYLAQLRDSTTITVRNVATGVDTDILTGFTDTSVAIFAPSGQRLAISVLSAAGGGSHGGYVWDGNTAHTADQAFQRPMLTTEVSLTLSQPGAGVATVGTHSVGVLFQTRTGYWTRPGPATNSAALTLVPTTITATDSLHNIQATVTPTGNWPTWIQNIQLIYTTAANTFQYYLVPGTITAVTPGTNTAAVITFNVADLQIRSIGSQGAGTLADDYFSLLSNDNNNNPPFSVKFVVRWADRMVWFGNYGGVDSFFPSDPLNHQWISPDQHIKQLPGGLPISTAFVLRNILYVCSPQGGIWGYIDNGGRPVTFPKAVEIDAQIAVTAPQGVTTDSSGNAYALIGSVQGLYVFTGLGMPDMPVSWFAKPDWEQIDWTKFTSFQVKDHVSQHIFLARATLKSGAVQLFTFNYRHGKTPDKIEYSTWTITGGAGYPVGPVEIGFNSTSDIWELWVFPATNPATTHVVTLRQKSLKGVDALTTLYQDTDVGQGVIGIDWRYNMGAMPKDNMQVMNHIALMLRAVSVQAAGANLYVTVNSLDGGKQITPNGNPFALAQVQDTKVIIPYDFTNEDALYRFSNNAIANNAPLISFLEHYYTLFAMHR